METLHDAVDRELRALPEDIRASYQCICKMIGALGLDRVGMPHVRHLEGKLWEMRMKGRGDEARAIYSRGARMPDRGACGVHEEDAEDAATDDRTGLAA